MRLMKSTNPKDLYSQCSLRRVYVDENNLPHYVTTVSWIPSRWARLDQVLKLKGDDGIWQDGWMVTGVGATTDAPPDAHDGIKQHRKNTGDSLPK